MRPHDPEPDRPDGPDDEAYGRATNPARYQSVVDAAEELIARLSAAHDITRTAGRSDIDFPDLRIEPAPTTRLVPAAGAPVTFLVTEFPGVAIRFGKWGRAAFPECGCDACDERPMEVIERMRRLVEAAVDGRYREALTKRTLTWAFAGSDGESSEQRLERGMWRELGQPDVHDWPPWPVRRP